MYFDHCAKKIKDGLKEVVGITSVKVNLYKKEVIIVSNEELRASDLYEMITMLGFEVISIN